MTAIKFDIEALSRPVAAPLIDTHAHLNWPEFAADIVDVLRHARAQGVVGVLVVAMDQRCEPGLAELVQLAAERDGLPHIARGLGVHPINAAVETSDLDALERLFDEHADLCAVGECGLDFNLKQMPKGLDDANAALRVRQHDCLRRQIALAVKHQLPLNVHSRSAGHHTIDLIAEALSAVEAERRPPVLMHAFDGKAAHAKAAAARTDIDFYFSVAPSIVRGEQLQKMVAAVPIERLVLESDAPGLGPVLGERNVPGNVAISCRAIAQILEIDVDRVAHQTTQNAAKLFAKAFGAFGEAQ